MLTTRRLYIARLTHTPLRFRAWVGGVYNLALPLSPPFCPFPPDLIFRFEKCEVRARSVYHAAKAEKGARGHGPGPKTFVRRNRSTIVGWCKMYLPFYWLMAKPLSHTTHEHTKKQPVWMYKTTQKNRLGNHGREAERQDVHSKKIKIKHRQEGWRSSTNAPEVHICIAASCSSCLQLTRIQPLPHLHACHCKLDATHLPVTLREPKPATAAPGRSLNG